MKNNKVSHLIIIGTGFHRKISFKESNLSSWNRLLVDVRKNHELKKNDVFENDPVMEWEAMIADCFGKRSESDNHKKSSDVEREMKKTVCELLRKTSHKCNLKKVYDNNPVFSRISQLPTHIVSLNFDQMAYSKCKSKKIVCSEKIIDTAKKIGCRENELRLLHDRFICDFGDHESIIWHPHGHVGRMSSLVLGMRDYGFLPHSYYHAFHQFKKWERDIAGELTGPAKYDKLICALSEMDSLQKSEKITNPADNWVTRFMLYPVTFIGVGLSQVEIGMRWLLVQRARNFLRVPKGQEPVAEFYGEKDPRIPGLAWKRPDKKGFHDQMWKSALEH